MQRAMTEGSIPTHHEPVMGRSFGPNGMPPENNAPFTADARSVDGQAVLGSDDHAASFSQVRAPAPRERVLQRRASRRGLRGLESRDAKT